MPVVPFSPHYLAKLAGLEWSGTVEVRWADAYSSDLAAVDPFFEWLGSFDPNSRTILIYQRRCLRCARRLNVDPMTVARTVITHFCAHAVTLLGVHPTTGKKYIGAADPAKMFRNEQYPLRPSHHHYDNLIRQEELFAQIFAYLWTFWNGDVEEIRVFNLLSQGHADLYSLAPNGYVHPLLRRDWKSAIETNQTRAASTAARLLGCLTRGVPPSRKDLLTEFPQ